MVCYQCRACRLQHVICPWEQRTIIMYYNEGQHFMLVKCIGFYWFASHPAIRTRSFRQRLDSSVPLLICGGSVRDLEQNNMCVTYVIDNDLILLYS